MGWLGRSGGLRKYSENHDVASANSGFRDVEKKQESTRLANLFEVRDWKNARWNWKDAVCRFVDLTDGAKLLAVRLVDSFAHHETAFCNPAVDTMAEALGKSGRSVQRALSELQKAGWLKVDYAKGRGRTSKITFLCGPNTAALNTPEKVTRLAARHADQPDTPPETTSERVTAASPINSGRVTNSAGKGDSRVTPILKPKNNQKEREQSDDALGRPSPQCSKFVPTGSDWADEWDLYHAAKGFKPLAVIGLRISHNGVDGYDLPFNRPPKADHNEIDRAIALKFAAWATAEAEARHDH